MGMNPSPYRSPSPPPEGGELQPEPLTFHPDTCWLVWQGHDTDTYRCINCSTPEEAAKQWVEKYGPHGKYEVRVVLYRTYGPRPSKDGPGLFKVDKHMSIKAA